MEKDGFGGKKEELKTQKTKVAEAISVAAHQLKTPISIIKGYLEELLSADLGTINEKQREYLEDALNNVKRMSLLVNHVLEISRIDEGRYELFVEKFALEKLALEVINTFSGWAKASNVHIFYEKEDNLPLVLSDPFKIRQVIENIISNALKYKGVGLGIVNVAIKRSGNEVVFSCRDNGIGLASEDREKMFTKFYRSEKAVELDPSGTGLGLAINKAIINLSGGRIWFEENPDRGITFYFSLPIAI